MHTIQQCKLGCPSRAMYMSGTCQDISGILKALPLHPFLRVLGQLDSLRRSVMSTDAFTSHINENILMTSAQLASCMRPCIYTARESE